MSPHRPYVCILPLPPRIRLLRQPTPPGPPHRNGAVLVCLPPPVAGKQRGPEPVNLGWDQEPRGQPAGLGWAGGLGRVLDLSPHLEDEGKVTCLVRLR